MEARLDAGKVILRALDERESGRLTTALAAGGVAVYEIVTVRRDLENVFLDLIGEA
jgi:hypothetical protein